MKESIKFRQAEEFSYCYLSSFISYSLLNVKEIDNIYGRNKEDEFMDETGN